MPKQHLRYPNPTQEVHERAEALEIVRDRPDLGKLLLELKGSGAFTWYEIARCLRERLTAD